MNNEPVAWIHKTATSWVSTFIHPETEPDEWQPLYTHPVKELVLTDEEMINIYEKDWSGIKCGLGRAVEQAILRKAQEK